MLIIVDIILCWKNILWFQRSSEHVLKLRALWDVWVRGMRYLFWLCGDKKKTYSISFTIQMLMKVYLYCLFPLIDWSTRLGEEFIMAHALLCVCLNRKGGGGVRVGLALVICCKWVVCSKKKKKTYQPTIWSVVIKYTVFLCFLLIFSSVGVAV